MSSHVAGRALPRVGWRMRFGLLATIWGLSFLLVKVGTQGFPALQVAFGRVAFGAAALTATLVLRRDRLPRGLGLWAHLAVAAMFLNAASFALFAFAAQRIPSALTGICNATTPLFTTLASLVALPGERPVRRQLAGLLIGFLGVLVVLGVWDGTAGQSITGMALALAAATSMGVGWVYVRRFLTGSGCSSLALSTGQLAAGAVELVVVTAAFSDLPTRFPTRSLLAVLVLGVLGTGGAFLLQYGLVRDAGATVAATVTYVVPVVSTLAGVLLLGESLTWNEPAGTVVILTGAALSQRGVAAAATADPTANGSSALGPAAVTGGRGDRVRGHGHSFAPRWHAAHRRPLGSFGRDRRKR
nr:MULTISPECIES: DMT family transporter [Frankia]